MGLPIWKPRQRSFDEIQEDICKRHRSYYSRNVEQLSPSDRRSLLARHNNSNESVTSEPSYQIRRNILSRHLVTSAFTENESIPSSPEADLEDRMEHFILEKKDLLDKLQRTSLLLEQYLSVLTLTDNTQVSELSDQDFSNILEPARALASLSMNDLTFSFSSMNPDYPESVVNIPDYSNQIHNLDMRILLAHARIRQQLNLFSNITNNASSFHTYLRTDNARNPIDINNGSGH